MITQTEGAFGSSTTDADNFDTGSHTPPANQVILFGVLSSEDGSAGSPTVPTLSGNGLTWTQVNTDGIVAAGSEQRRVTLFWAAGFEPTTGVTNIDFGGVSQDSVAWVVSSFAGCDNANPIVQSDIASVAVTSSLTVNLAAFLKGFHATYGVAGLGSNKAVTEGSGFTKIREVQQGGSGFDAGTIVSQWRNDPDTSVDWSWTGNANAAGIAVELRHRAPIMRRRSGPLLRM